MPKLARRLTDSTARDVPAPASAYQIFWCKDAPGFGVRVTDEGARSWVMERRVAGKTVRRTLGKVTGRGAISADAARRLMLLRSSELQQGTDELAVRREQARQQERDVTFAVALAQYVAEKRRAKDGLALKDRTKADYLSMLRVGGIDVSGKAKCAGELHPLANKRLSTICGDDLRKLYEDLLQRGQRRATYAMQITRAVLNWHGVSIADNPLSRQAAGRDRIVLPRTAGKPNPIPPEQLGRWWRVACQAGRDGNPGRAASADYLRFLLLTGLRGGEIAGNAHEDGVLMRQVDLAGSCIVLYDTKNRRDHTVYLSTEALEIAKRHAAGKRPGARLFSIRDPGKTLDAICAAADVNRRSLHTLRKTFASVAESLVSTYTLRRMLNHVDAGDVTGVHYVGKGEQELRAGWQAVADFVNKLAFSDLQPSNQADTLAAD